MKIFSILISQQKPLVRPMNSFPAREIRNASRDWASMSLSPVSAGDLELLMNGGFSPLRGFMGKVDYESLLARFFEMHNPTTLNRQGPDIGSQYRSAIFYLNDQQQQLAQASLERHQASGRFRQPIVTEITVAGPFWLAEAEHQQYLAKNPNGYCGLGGTGVDCPQTSLSSTP